LNDNDKSHVLLTTNPKFIHQNIDFEDTSYNLNTNNNNDDTISNALDRGPFFERTASKNVTALVGNTAYLNCRVRNLGNRTVTWIRHRDLHLLTVGKMTYTSDQRFQTVHNPYTDDWSLKVRLNLVEKNR
jgi:hypothetical protein